VDKLHLNPIDRATLNDEVKAGLERLYIYQHDDGGWGWWPDDQSLVFMTAYVVSGLGQAKEPATRSTTIVSTRLAPSASRARRASQHDCRPARLHRLRARHHRRSAKDALDAAWSSRDKLSDEGLALVGLALDAAGDSRAKDAATLLEKKAKSPMSTLLGQGITTAS